MDHSVISMTHGRTCIEQEDGGIHHRCELLRIKDGENGPHEDTANASPYTQGLMIGLKLLSEPYE